MAGRDLGAEDVNVQFVDRWWVLARPSCSTMQCDLLADLGCGSVTVPVVVPLAGLVGRTDSQHLSSDEGAEFMTACMAYQANAYGIVRDVGFIGPLTRCRSGLTGTVATRSGYRSGGARSWPSFRSGTH
jgi:hypothetical protein